MKSESRGHQNEPFHFRMRRRVKRRQIAAHTRADKRHGLGLGDASDHRKLFRKSEMLEIPLGQIGNLHLKTKLLQLGGKELSLAGNRTRSKAVEIKDARGSGQPLYISLRRMLQSI